MELHYLRCFLAMTEELHFVRATEGEHIDLSPITPSRLSALFAQCREEDSEVEARLFEVPLSRKLFCAAARSHQRLDCGHFYFRL